MSGGGRLGSKDRFRPIKSAGWSGATDAALRPSPETIAAVERFEKRKQGKTEVPGDLHPIVSVTDEARDSG
jgi:hypothetical protein